MTLKREKKPFDHKAEFFFGWGGERGGGGAGRGGEVNPSIGIF